MNLDFSQLQAPEGPVVELTGATLPLLPAYDVGLESVDLTVEKGALVMILLEHGAQDHPLADVVSGLVQLEEGRVRIFGGEWRLWNPDQQAKARWRIGRVFNGHGWMSNLDVDENVTLAERHHGQRALAGITEEMTMWARLVGLEAIPFTRPSVTDREELRRSEWVRAALGNPWLLLLERPGRELADGWLSDLAPLVHRLRTAGAAVIWLAESDEEWGDDSLNASLKLRAEDNKLFPV
ncbi:MAG TPA: hypothetical protein PKE26_02565 [Kiritimatiellia bacterium]|nr:hypothetical protein [Kiritimatiellia bacterium]HMO97971.1 hypothetical protein [Kiritimatiellia bacterium]HMP95322.1 hypothetical protein [Kiritimatiellia bacterium]